MAEPSPAQGLASMDGKSMESVGSDKRLMKEQCCEEATEDIGPKADQLKFSRRPMHDRAVSSTGVGVCEREVHEERWV